MSDRPDEALNHLLDELELQSRRHRPSRHAEGPWVCQRRHPRNAFRASCNVYFLLQGGSRVDCLPGRTRNLSRCGVGLLVRRVFRPGEPIEVEIVLPDRPSMYLAGLVMFCRDAGLGYCEIGVSLKTVSGLPLFSRDPAGALAAHDWLTPQPAPVGSGV